MTSTAVISRQETVRVRGEVVPVTVVEPASGGADLLFLHGYARDPRDYAALLECLAREGHRVVAPFLFANGALRTPPVHFWACVALALRTAGRLVDEGRLAPGAPTVGHSTGGAVTLTLGAAPFAPRALVAINPVQPSEDPPLLFMLRSAWMNTKMALGLAGEGPRGRAILRETGGRFYGNWLRSPLRNYRLIGGLRAFDHDALSRWYRRRGAFDGPATVLYGHGDEFYPSVEGMREGLGAVFPRFALEELLDQNSHEWLLLRPERAAERVLRALER